MKMEKKIIGYMFGETTFKMVPSIKEAERFKQHLENKYKMPSSKIKILLKKTFLYVYYPKPVPLYDDDDESLSSYERKQKK
jgi:hypothetical protein